MSCQKTVCSTIQNGMWNRKHWLKVMACVHVPRIESCSNNDSTDNTEWENSWDHFFKPQTYQTGHKYQTW